ncbi:MAG: response regulator transcription factor [Saprospiraceae bacterium]|nr:response regulator transcription factor [Saprospiraceae bacterium]
MKAVIIDDEAQSHISLKTMLAKSGKNIEVVGSAYCVEEGIVLIDKKKPDIVFLDVNMPDGLGFDVLKNVQHAQFCTIFTTAHEQHAITAIKFGALDYLLKPYSIDELMDALEKVEQRVKQNTKNISDTELNILMDVIQKLPQKELPQRIGISTATERVYVKVENICRFEADTNCTILHLVNEKKKKLVSTTNLGKYIDLFAPYKSFMKVHRSHLVNLMMVEKYVRADGGYLIMNDGSEISVANNNRDELLHRLDHL